jgi:hypothetical protein
MWSQRYDMTFEFLREHPRAEFCRAFLLLFQRRTSLLHRLRDAKTISIGQRADVKDLKRKTGERIEINKRQRRHLSLAKASLQDQQYPLYESWKTVVVARGILHSYELSRMKFLAW